MLLVTFNLRLIGATLYFEVVRLSSVINYWLLNLNSVKNPLLVRPYAH